MTGNLLTIRFQREISGIQGESTPVLAFDSLSRPGCNDSDETRY